MFISGSESRCRSNGRTRRRLVLALTSACLGVQGCHLEPKYVRPQVPAPPAYMESPAGSSSVVWKPAQPQEIAVRGRWWERFGDPELNRLEEGVDASNQQIAAAAADYAAARALVREVRSQYFPQLSAGLGLSQERITNFGGTFLSNPAEFTQYTVPVEASWEPDLWGRVRSSVHTQALSAQASAADLENVRLAMHAQLAQDYFALQAQYSLKEVLDHSVTTDRDILQITTQLYRAGLGTDEAVAAADSQLQATTALNVQADTLVAQYQHAIAILLGKAPADMRVATGPMHATPPEIPAGVPSDLLQRRPDIASAERSVAAANAQIGVARSAYYPELNLSAAVGFSTTSATEWFSW